MNFFRKIDQRILFAWAILLSLLILCAQGVKLHVHSFDHDPHQNHHSIDNLNDHSHLSEAHLSIDISHEDHHDEVTSEIDACPDCILKQASGNVLVLALLVMALTLFLPGLSRYIFHRHHGVVSIPWRHHLFPPLRAPPL